jgi:4-hydroxybutyryl-CoA dehydratase/vinylacetyl-CoA-Delta-isomerase
LIREKETHLREQMVELITITESFFACGVAASVYAKPDEHSHSFMPDPVFSNIGKLLLATKIYDMHRIAHYVSGGLIVTLPGPDEDHNPETAAKLSEVLRANPDVPYEQRIQTARFIEDLTAGYQGGWYSVISLHGGGSPAAMKQEIYRNYPIGSKVELVERLLERGVAADGTPAAAPHDPAVPSRATASPANAATRVAPCPARPSWWTCPLWSKHFPRAASPVQPFDSGAARAGVTHRVCPMDFTRTFDLLPADSLSGEVQAS